MSAWWFRPVVYRVYDMDDRLIYIGASHHLHLRMATHAKRSWWWGLVGRIHFTEYAERDYALAAEEVAIQEEQPAFNIRGTTDGPVLTEADAAYAREWWRQPGNYLMSLTLIDRLNAMRDAAEAAA